MIVCFGEVLIDCLPDGDVIGGAPFNVAIHLKRFGHDAVFVSRIGEDKYGEMISALLEKEGLTSYVKQDDAYRTGIVTVKFVDNEPQYTIEENCAWQYVSFQEVDQRVEYFIFGSLGLWFPENKSTFEAYKSKYPDAKYICDINLRAPFYSHETVDFCLQNADVLKVNEDEWEYLKEMLQVASAGDLLTELADKYGIEEVLLTRGADGVEVYWGDDVYQVPAGNIDPAQFQDTIGAGDSFTATFIHGLISSPSTIEDNTIKAADFAAGICMNKGAIPQDQSLYSK